jgi:hypothetical protein
VVPHPHGSEGLVPHDGPAFSNLNLDVPPYITSVHGCWPPENERREPARLAKRE